MNEMEPKDNTKRKIDETINNEEDISEEDEIEYVEETSESEPELDCDLWDTDCKVIGNSCKNQILCGRHLMPTCSRDPEIHVNKKHKLSFEINDNLTQTTFLKNFTTSWNQNETIENNNVELIIEPFKVIILNNFLQNQSLLDHLREEFNELDWNYRNMDLYEFFQSKDLKYINKEYIKKAYAFLQTEALQYVAKLTGLELTHISATCSLYSNTDYLLLHDDQREDRMVAFVLYLTGEEGWDFSKGGALQLFSKNDIGQPKDVVRNILPQNNQLVLFPVTNDSYHQVAEVTSINDCRLSINGWFHTKIQPVFQTPVYTPLENSLYSSNCFKAKTVDIDLQSWINEEYLKTKSIKLIQQHIEENSEISLKSFLKQESFLEISNMLNNEDIVWEKVGPPNRYSYEIINITQLPHIIERLLNLFQSREMFSLLQKYTDLELTTENASMKFELQRWIPGSYSLLTDYNWQEKNELDLIIYFGCKNSHDVIGARTHYVTIEDEIQNALITIEPEENNLNIVYRDSARFTKYFSKLSKCQKMYTLICSYSE